MTESPPDSRGAPYLAGLVLLLFFFSGALALIYEVVWLRMLILIFGSTHFAVTTVLTAFMAGLALGAYAMGRVADRCRRSPVALYGILEIGIGLYALLVPLLFGLLLPISRWLWAHFSPTFYVFSFLRFLFVGSVLILPTAMMGATLPVLSRFVTRRRDAMGLSVGTLYGLNTFGAVVGTAATGFLMIPAMGVQRTVYLAAALNLLLGLTAIVLSRSGRGEAPALEEVGPAPEAARGIPPDLRLILVVFGISGFVAMVYEVAWTRVLALVIGSSVYAFTVMLTTFLVGLAAGASIMSRLADRLADRWGRETIAAIMAGTGTTAFGTLLLFHELPYSFSLAFHWIHSRGAPGQEQYLLFVLEFLFAALVMLPPTLFLGGMFPIVVRICGARLPRVGRTVGTAYAANTVGTILGSALAGFVVLPVLGIQGAIVAAILTNLALTILLLLTGGPERARGKLAAASLCALAAACIWSFQPQWNALVMNSGVYQYAANLTEQELTPDGFYDWSQRYFDLRFYKEGVVATVMVAGELTTNDIWLTVNGKIDASSHGDLQTQLLSGHLPVLLAENPRDVVVIGYASGITVGAALQYPVRSLTAVEIEPAIIEASRHFTEHNHDPLSDPRVDVVTADGRNFLLVTPERYDVIISEPSNPWMTVASNLFTREFFQVGRDRLRPGGVFCQWLQLYGMQPSDLRALTRTFTSVFPNVLVFNTIWDSDLLLMGAMEPMDLDLERMRQRMSGPEVALDLERVRVSSPYDLLTYFLMGDEEVRAYAGDGKLNTDDNALIEFHAPRSLHFQTRGQNRRLLLDHLADPFDYLSGPPGTPEAEAEYYLEMARAYMKRGMVRFGKEAVASAILIHDSEEARELQRTILEAAEGSAGARDS